jgi:hypothetical protein
MKRTLNALLVDDLAADSEVGSHVQTVGLQGVDDAVGATVDDDVVAVDVDGFHLSWFEFVSFGDVVPSVGVGRGWLPHVLLGDVILSSKQKVWSMKLVIIDKIEY